MPDKWYYTHGGAVHGPVTSIELRPRAAGLWHFSADSTNGR